MHTRKALGRVTLRERANGECVFWDRQAGCTVYPARPAQCRTWPFWESVTEIAKDVGPRRRRLSGHEPRSTDFGRGDHPPGAGGEGVTC